MSSSMGAGRGHIYSYLSSFLPDASHDTRRLSQRHHRGAGCFRGFASHQGTGFSVRGHLLILVDLHRARADPPPGFRHRSGGDFHRDLVCSPLWDVRLRLDGCVRRDRRYGLWGWHALCTVQLLHRCRPPGLRRRISGAHSAPRCLCRQLGRSIAGAPRQSKAHTSPALVQSVVSTLLSLLPLSFNPLTYVVKYFFGMVSMFKIDAPYWKSHFHPAFNSTMIYL